MNIRVGMLILGLLAVLGTATGRSAELAQFDSQSIRFAYDKTDSIPDGVFYPKFVEFITAHLDGHDRLHTLMDIRSNLSLSDNESAEHFLQIILTEREAIRNERESAMRTMVCPLNSPRPLGSNVYSALNAVDDAGDVIGERHLSALKKEIGDAAYAAFIAWMQKVKRQSKVIRFDHAKKNAGQDPNMVRQEVCGLFDAKQSRKR